MTWTPDESALKQLAAILQGTLSPDAAVRQQATAALGEAQHQDQFAQYLCAILVDGTGFGTATRAAAGVALKNMVASAAKWRGVPVEVRREVQQMAVRGIADPERMVRNITGSVVSALVAREGVRDWPGVLESLMQLAEGAGGQGGPQQGALGCLAKICEDDATSAGSAGGADVDSPLNWLVPRLLALARKDDNSSADISALALQCLTYALERRAQAVLARMDDFLGAAFALAAQPSPVARKAVCAALNEVVAAAPAKLAPHLRGLVDYCVAGMDDDDDAVALQMCEVLLSAASCAELPGDALQQSLDTLVPALLAHMVYSDAEVFLMEEEDERDDGREDRDQDVRPVQAVSRARANAGGASADDGSASADNDGVCADDSDADEDSVDSTAAWTIRKCSAATLDMLASRYPAQVLARTLPEAKRRAEAPAWPVREAGLLALGAIAEGCWQQAAPQLPAMIPFVVTRLTDPQPRVRQIACWTVARYAAWICGEADAHGACAGYFSATLQAVMRCAVDSKRAVQQSGCSALADFIDAASRTLLAPFVAPLLRHFVQCFQRYRRKNLLILYDTVQTFAEKLGDLVARDAQLVALFLPPLIARWHALPDTDTDLWPLLECMSSVAASFGRAFAPYAPPVYARALRILSACLRQQEQYAAGQAEEPDTDFLVTSLDLIDGLVQGLGEEFVGLANKESAGAGNGSQLMDLVLASLRIPADDARQSAFALLGDLCACAREIVTARLHDVLLAVAEEISAHARDSPASANNAVWALGELALAQTDPAPLAPYLDNFVRLLGRLLLDSSDSLDSSLLENAAICIGRLAVHSPQAIASGLPQLLSSWCEYVRFLEDNEEKASAFQGICNAIASCPGCLDPARPADCAALAAFVACIAAYENPGDALLPVFRMLLQAFRRGLGDRQWHQLVAQLDSDAVASLARYQLD